jgi:hypothetical protein
MAMIGSAPVVALASVVEATPVAIKPLPAWDVGSADMDWRVIFAETEEAAQRIWYEDKHGEPADSLCDCGCGEQHSSCLKFGEGLPEARRAPHWDNPENAEPSIDELYQAGWISHCNRCGNEVDNGDGDSDIIDHTVLCHDCMTDDELRTVAPDHWRFDDEDDSVVSA